MGAKLTQFYEEAKKIGGIKAQMRMAILTKMPSTQASISPDSQENINISDLANGTYYLNLRNGNKQMTKKFSIVR